MHYGIALGLVCLVFAGNIVCNSVQPVFGLPLFFLWNIISVFIITAVMWIVYTLDPRNKIQESPGDSDRSEHMK